MSRGILYVMISQTVKRLKNGMLFANLTIFVGFMIVSVVVGQMSSPYHFRFVDRDDLAGIVYAKASVSSGDLNLVQKYFFDTVSRRHEEIFRQHVEWVDFLNRLEFIKTKIEISRNLELAIGYVKLASGDKILAEEHFENAKKLDPTAELPSGMNF
jgi:hypothetical protein